MQEVLYPTEHMFKIYKLVNLPKNARFDLSKCFFVKNTKGSSLYVKF